MVCVCDVTRMNKQQEGRFQSEVYGPLLAEVEVGEPQHAKYLEQHCPNYLWSAFVTTSHQDQALLNREIGERHRATVINFTVRAPHPQTMRMLSPCDSDTAALTIRPEVTQRSAWVRECGATAHLGLSGSGFLAFVFLLLLLLLLLQQRRHALRLVDLLLDGDLFGHSLLLHAGGTLQGDVERPVQKPQGLDELTEQYKLVGTLDMVYEAPAVVKHILNDMAGTGSTLVGSNNTERLIDRLIAEPGVRCVWTPSSQYTMTKSRYANTTTSRVVAVRECQFFSGGQSSKKEKEHARVRVRAVVATHVCL